MAEHHKQRAENDLGYFPPNFKHMSRMEIVRYAERVRDFYALVIQNQTLSRQIVAEFNPYTLEGALEYVESVKREAGEKARKMISDLELKNRLSDPNHKPQMNFSNAGRGDPHRGGKIKRSKRLPE